MPGMSPGLSRSPGRPRLARALRALRRACSARHLAATIGLCAAAAGGPGLAAPAAALPDDVLGALRRSGVPEQALAYIVQDATTGRTLHQWQADLALNPASLAKLVTTQAALEQLGPGFAWSTPVWLQGPVRDGGVLDGHLHIRGSGDPKLVHERLWLLLRRVMQLGVREIRGDIVLDNSAFAVPALSPGEFDGEPLRAYNVQPAALLLNYRAVIYTFTPDAAAGVARVSVEPALARTEVDRTVPLVAGACNDWRGALDARFGAGPASVSNMPNMSNAASAVSTPNMPIRTMPSPAAGGAALGHAGNAGGGANGREVLVRFAGRYPLACGERTWALADAQPASYDARLLEGLWREMGGTLGGRVREGPAPAATPPTFEQRSPALAEVVRDINKFSNNVMAEQLALTLAREAAPSEPATPEAARALLRRWLGERLGGAAAASARLGNGSGLSRDSRLSPRQLARLLVLAHAAPTMPEFVASLPVVSVDGTTRQLRGAAGRAHLKTGGLRDVAGLAGYVLAADGRRLVFVALVNHPQARAARAVFEVLLHKVAS
jgi:D-alanyl-D-alanine carboxypeptidase/D-alanyl-D-alanine-endopeptidase (penicillin-binding protein 4)